MTKLFDNSRRTGRFSRRPAFRPQAEALESRNLLSGSSNNTLVWFTEFGANRIGVIHTDTSVINSVALPAGSEPDGITVGPDGNIWFTEFGANRIGVYHPNTNVVNTIALPAGGTEPVGITVGPDGNLWFTEFGSNRIGMINPVTSAITDFQLAAGSEPEGITA
ncbi:MAG TPA: SMP-30/gluconolactonase/LRE family protein, partial [Isosphaeraceae bacterium]|nr:SMP-30/gluconolactonase/LRE family protein [Isosphaeraceae bacterium]